jgi:prophage regulatory protein
LDKEQIRVLRRKDVEAMTGLSRSSIYQGIQDGAFPRPIKLGPKAVGWVESEVTSWIEERILNREISQNAGA